MGVTHCNARKRPDILFASGCCQAYTALRCKKDAPPEEHPTFSVQFGESGSIISACDKLKPLVAVCEQVMPFGSLVTKASEEAYANSESNVKSTYLDEFCDRMSTLKLHPDSNKPLFTGCKAIMLNVGYYVHGSRPRVHAPDSSLYLGCSIL